MSTGLRTASILPTERPDENTGGGWGRGWTVAAHRVAPRAPRAGCGGRRFASGARRRGAVRDNHGSVTQVSFDKRLGISASFRACHLHSAVRELLPGPDADVRRQQHVRTVVRQPLGERITG